MFLALMCTAPGCRCSHVPALLPTLHLYQVPVGPTTRGTTISSVLYSVSKCRETRVFCFSSASRYLSPALLLCCPAHVAASLNGSHFGSERMSATKTGFPK